MFQGRTALFHAAALSEFDDIGMYGWLMNMGYDKNHQDNVSKLCNSNNSYCRLLG